MRGDADNRDATRHVANHDRPRPDRHVIADPYFTKDYCAYRDLHVVAEGRVLAHRRVANHDMLTDLEIRPNRSRSNRRFKPMQDETPWAKRIGMEAERL
jgi:hypothetical protein